MLRAVAIVWVVLSGCRLRFDERPDDARSGDVPSDTLLVSDGGPSAVRLLTKHVYGAPGGTFTIASIGGDAPDLELRFLDPAYRVLHTSTVTSSGAVTLPVVAGIYRTELHDRRTGGRSFGQATITTPVSSFAPIQQMSITGAYNQYAPQWPVTPMVATDIDGDGHPDLVRSSGNQGPPGIPEAGIYAHRWIPTMDQLATATYSSLPDRNMCGFVMFDHDADGDPDVVTAAVRPATYELELCVLFNDGTGAFTTPACQVEAGTVDDHFACTGSVAAGDFDRDGRIDLALAGGRLDALGPVSAEVRLYANRGNAPFTLEASWSTHATENFESLALADLDDDGRLDVIANGGSPSLLHLFRATADFALADPIQLTAVQGGYPHDAIVAAYIDDDTTLDVALVHVDGPSSIWYGAAAAPAAIEIPTFLEQHGTRFHVADLDIDGEVDVIIPYKNRFLEVDRAGGMIKRASTLTDNVAPTPENSIYGAVPSNDWCLVSFLFPDLDQDGALDAVFVHGFTRTLETLLGTP